MISHDDLDCKEAVTVRLIKHILEMSEQQQTTLLKQLEDPSFFPGGFGERDDIRRPYINEIEFESKGCLCKGASQDISGGGMFIKTTEKFSVGNTIVLKIPFTDNQKKIRVPAEIVRIASDGIGVEFLKAAD
jgi:hypothetical protein